MTAKLGLRGVLGLICLGHLGFAAAQPAVDPEGLDRLTLVAPSAPGSGWDRVAQAMKQVLEGDGIVRSVNIQNVPGDGGLSGLSRFVGSRRGDGRSVLVGGMFMIGAAVSGNAVSALNDLAPIAQLTSDADVVAVPASSPYRTLDDLLAAMRRNPGAMRWVGASVGGTDHPTMWQLARAAGVAPDLLHYESFTGENEVAAHLASGRFSAGIDGYSVFESLIRSGQLRGLAMISRQPLDGVDIPTFRELGIVGVSISNWCGAFAAPGVSDSDRARLAAAIQRMVASPHWRALLNQYHLRDAYRDGKEFPRFVRQEERRVTKSQAASVARNANQSVRGVSGLWAPLLASGIIALLIVLCLQKLSARRREESLRRALQEVSEEVAQRRTLEAQRVEIHSQIEREFDRWGLTGAERSVAHLMLKGMRLKGIAAARNTSDRTVRQQAQAIYRKAGLDGRTDLAAYFLDSVLGGPELERDPKAVAAVAGGPALQVAGSKLSARISGVSKMTRPPGRRATTAHKPAVLPLGAVAEPP